LAFGQQFSSLIGPIIQIYGSSFVYRTGHLFVLFSPRECSPLYLCTGDAENAHRQEIFCLYATEMQKMRISMTLFVYPLPSGGWVEGESLLFIEQNTSAKFVDHLPPLHLRGSVGRKHQHRALKSRYRWFAIRSGAVWNAARSTGKST
jgi:hypothetical protein